MALATEANRKIVDAAREAFNAKDLDGLVEIFAESAIHVHPASPEPFKGRDAIRRNFETAMTAFPDGQNQLLGSIGQGEWICQEWLFRAHHKGALPGPGGQIVKPTNRPVELRMCIVFKVEDGKIAEAHEYYDLLGMMAQLGLVPQGA
ncbi:MAG: ester cyclase [Euryarchaeota archaeon]|nr:ester cyclase [Euryarchaeota archaeon]